MIKETIVKLKENELAIKEFVQNELGKGKISNIKIEYTPVGEKIIIYTSRPGMIIGKRGEKIYAISETLKKRFKLENPYLEIMEITKPQLDAQTIADEIALQLEKFGPLKFKIVAYKMLQQIKNAGALGAEIRLSGKLPSERAKSWRFAFGYLKKTGDTARFVSRAKSSAQTTPGTVGIKVEILPDEKEASIYDKVEIDKSLILIVEEKQVKEEEKEKKVSKRRGRKKKMNEEKGKSELEKEVEKEKKEEKEVEEEKGVKK